ncbi:MAG: PBP1A family penicillin-binding protein [Minwuia sp.]|nr:PBP1A family penicillin-binding protein [Minwuia sp.]
MIRHILKWGLLLALAATVVVAVILLHDLPAPHEPVSSGTVTILDQSGREIAIYGGPGSRAIPIERLPRHVLDAVIATEDRRFYSHFGIDPIGIVRAAFINLTSGRVVQGGSTLTQQLAKNLYLGPQQTLKRKAQEAVLALGLESRFSKDEILEMYLNRVYFGAGTYGIEAASERYFAKSASDLTLREAALIAGLLKAPSRYDPTRNPQGAAARMRIVVNNMVDAGLLDPGQARAVLDAPAIPVGRPRGTVIRYATDRARDEVADLIGTPDGDIRVRTTIDGAMQDAAGQALSESLRRNGSKSRVGQGAVVILDTTGAIRALVGGKDYGESQYNRAILARRQPGSAFKPFLYLAALEAGFTPTDTVLDEPIEIDGWKPANFANRYLGRITLTEALARSVNAGTVWLAREVGWGKAIEMAHRLGINADLPDNPSIVLGTTEITPLAMAGAFVPLANGGRAVVPHLITRIDDADGDAIWQRRGDGGGPVLSARVAGEMNQMMAAVIQTGSGRAARLDRPAGGKTGTSQDNRDAWFVGYSADLIAAVWVGNDNDAPTRNVSGSGLPAQIWRSAMLAAHRGLPVRPLPAPPERGLFSFGDGRAPPSMHSDGDDAGGGLWGRLERLFEAGARRQRQEGPANEDFPIELPK